MGLDWFMTVWPWVGLGAASVLLIVLFAYFHHLYMDFVQPGTLQYIGQIASYASAIPASVVTLFGALLLVYHARMRWNLTSILLFLGLAGWAVGGIGAVIEKRFEGGREALADLGVPIETLAVITAMDNGKITLEE